jgi:EAL domain-containing protein (putative c-di-GMP-specific phosphodiesterase class I)
MRVFEPIFDLRSRKVVGYEVLLQGRILEEILV